MPDNFEIDPAREKVVIEITKEEDARRRILPPEEEPLGMLPTMQYRRRTFRRPDEDAPENCIWSRYWDFTYKHYRVWNVAGVFFNGTLFFNRVVTNYSNILENLSVQQGASTAMELPEVIEPFDPNALPMPEGSTVSFTFNKETGVGSLSTPFGTYPINPPFVNIPGLGQRWRRTYQFRNYYLGVMLRKEVGKTTTLTYDAEPRWVNFGARFEVSRNGGALILLGVNTIQDFSQEIDYVDGGYTLPDHAPCNEANIQAEDARAAFELAFDSYLHISAIVFGAMQGG
jgi:hypothetical protein